MACCRELTAGVVGVAVSTDVATPYFLQLICVSKAAVKIHILIIFWKGIIFNVKLFHLQIYKRKIKSKYCIFIEK